MSVNGADARIIGGFSVHGNASDIIFHRLTIRNPEKLGQGDGVTIKGSLTDPINAHPHHIWIDHCTFVDCADEMVDCSRASGYVTLSGNKLYYTRDNGHNCCNLTGGAGDNDKGNYQVAWCSMGSARRAILIVT